MRKGSSWAPHLQQLLEWGHQMHQRRWRGCWTPHLQLEWGHRCPQGRRDQVWSAAPHDRGGAGGGVQDRLLGGGGIYVCRRGGSSSGEWTAMQPRCSSSCSGRVSCLKEAELKGITHAQATAANFGPKIMQDCPSKSRTVGGYAIYDPHFRTQPQQHNKNHHFKSNIKAPDDRVIPTQNWIPHINGIVAQGCLS